MKKNNQPEIVWHYTTGEKFGQIVESGCLLPTGVWVEPPEEPILWFSKHPYYEPTARKEYMKDGEIRLLTVEEMYRLGGGLVRLGMKPVTLLQGNALRAAAKMPLGIWNALGRIALQQGSCAQHWWGTLDAIPVDSMVIEVMDEDMTWKRVQG
ncbi:MAG TPA: hypothetical protein PLE74_12060 [Candidatus Cloacimonadota bacterium]|nr:hypothetical protein [Candidatus Cloacimonadota bacterium]